MSVNLVFVIKVVDESREITIFGKRPPNPVDFNNCGGLPHTIKLAIDFNVTFRQDMSFPGRNKAI